MTERLLQYIWQFQYFNRQELQTVSGESLQIIFPGEWNHNQGPDFRQARIRIGDTFWAGEIELHLQATDWNKHRHSKDRNYNKVILHVVWENDVQIADERGFQIPSLELHNRVSNLLLQRYESLMYQHQQIPCHADIGFVAPIVIESWKERLLIERLEEKAVHIQQLLLQTRNNWEEVFWCLLCRYFGTPLNNDCFEQMAASLPLSIVTRHKNQVNQVEALLLGQAGLLAKKFTDHYALMLQNEFGHLKKKYQLQPISKLPVFLRMRPVNFPTVRLAQLAMLIHQSKHLFSKVKEEIQLKNVSQLFAVTANDFWNYHFQLDEESDYQPKTIGSTMINTLLINAIIPIMYAYGKYAGEPALCDRALKWLEEIAPENNAITKCFTNLGVDNFSSFDSQALIHLKKEYCDVKRCLECAVGNAILKR